MARGIEAPIFFIGMPRSGTTMLFEIFAAHDDVAWFSQHVQRAPAVPAVAALSRLADLTPRMRRSVGRSDQARPFIEKLRVGPVEAYGLWSRCCGEKFPYDYLLGVDATARERECVRGLVAKVLRYQGKPRFAAKITGPGRIGYLSSIFPDARFVHVLRDGRAVTQSLLRVPFWEERNRRHEPAWENGLTDTDIADWERYERSPLALAAVQWRRVVESTRAEAASLAPERYAEVHYEAFVAHPDQLLGAILSFCGLRDSARMSEFLDARFELRDMNFQWRERFDDSERAMLNELISGTLSASGYGVDPPTAPTAGERVSTPFLANGAAAPTG